MQKWPKCKKFWNCLSAEGAKADVPSALHSADDPPFFVFLSFSCIYVCCGSMCSLGSMWAQQSYSAVLHLHLWWYYWNMDVLPELLIIEIIFLQSKFTQSAQLLDVFFKSVQWAGVGWYVADSAFLLPELSCHNSSFCIPAPVLSGQESRQLFLFKTKLITYLCILQFENL